MCKLGKTKRIAIVHISMFNVRINKSTVYHAVPQVQFYNLLNWNSYLFKGKSKQRFWT